MRRRAAMALLICALLTICFPTVAKAWGESALSFDDVPDLTAKAAALCEAASGRYLCGKNAQERLPMASTTKVMTALIAVERCALDEMVAVPDEAVGVEGSSAYLARGETLSMRDLLFALMLTSGNDAAITIAVYLGGSVEGFAALMNQRARQIGCTDTQFVNPNGLPSDAHYTTAADLCRVAATAMQNAAFREIVATTYHQTTTGDYARVFKNKNKVLWQYDGGCGVKTGFTKAAGRCLVFAAERDGTLLVGVVLNAPDMWSDAASLLDFGFERVRNNTLVSCETPLGVACVTNSAKKGLAYGVKADILYPLSLDQSDEVSWDLRIESALRAPLEAGERVGTLRLYVNGVLCHEAELIALESADLLQLEDFLRQIARAWCS